MYKVTIKLKNVDSVVYDDVEDYDIDEVTIDLSIGENRKIIFPLINVESVDIAKLDES
jgi:PHD/YefM family antitoxin component YafN of YafNO toxin-antitoxin module